MRPAVASESPAPPVSDGGGLPGGPPTSQLPDRIINGRYRVLAQLESTRLGQRFLAQDPVSGERVALTVLPDELAADAEFAATFRHQSRTTPAGVARGAAPVRAYEVTPDGKLLVVTEHVEGRTLEEELREHPVLDLGRGLRLAIQLGEVLEAVHNVGLVHGDLRPDSVLLVGEPERVELRGLELAPLRQAALSRSVRTPVIAGASEYLAPEQIGPGEVTERTDVYAFGLLLYRMLTGHSPFEAAALAQPAVDQRVLDPPASPRVWRSEIPRSVERIVLATLARDPRDRPDITGVVNDLWEALGRIGSRSAARWTIPHRALPVALALSLLTALGLAIVVGRAGWRPVAAPPARTALPVPGERSATPLPVGPLPVAPAHPPASPVEPAPGAGARSATGQSVASDGPAPRAGGEVPPPRPERPPGEPPGSKPAADPGSRAAPGAEAGARPKARAAVETEVGPRSSAGADGTDPGAIIDWLLKEGTGR